MTINTNDTITCPICYDHQTDPEFITLQCGCYFCYQCLTSWIITKTNELSYQMDHPLPCMTSDCKHLFKVDQIRSQMPTDIQNTLNDSFLQVYINKTEDIRQCPNMTCKYAGIINTSSSCSNNLECCKCQTQWRERVHFTLQDRIRVFLHDKISLKNEFLCLLWKRNHTKKCPNCNVSIEKNEGCENMVCSQCKHGFCWTCFAPAPVHNQKIHNVISNKKLILFVLAIIAIIFLAYALYQIPVIKTNFWWLWSAHWQLGLAISLDFAFQTPLFYGTRKNAGKRALIQLLAGSCVINYYLGPSKTLTCIGIGEMFGLLFDLKK